jgi:hypothetical protein
MPGTMEGYTIYDSPLDFPGRFVVRRFEIKHGAVFPDDDPVVVADSLEAARAAVPEYMTRLARSPDDALSVVETWI